jgi:hypothetical protein
MKRLNCYVQRECKEHLQNQSIGRQSSEWDRVVAPAQFHNNATKEILQTGKGLVGPPGLEPGTNRL